MIFTQPIFFIFFALVFTVYWMLPWHRERKWLLLVGSMYFYGSWDWRFLFLIGFTTMTDYALGAWIARTEAENRRKALIILSLAINLGVLGFFKYFNFFIESGIAMLNAFGARADYFELRIVLPVGISFFTFQSLSYTLDVYRRAIPPAKSLADFALFVAFFPQLVAGPIVRASDFLPQLDHPKRYDAVRFKYCLTLFFIGFFKKACVADNLAPLVDAVFKSPESYATSAVWLAVFSYAAQIYCDFSGYTDMAIASAGLLGYTLCENFRHPYFATNITDFWRRWHMSLSTWLRDYLYVPLGGNRGGVAFGIRNVLITMTLGGLWHGAGINFILWGFLHGIALAIHRLTGTPRPAPNTGITMQKIFGVLFTFFVVSQLWVLFRAPEVSIANKIFSVLYGWNSGGDITFPALLLYFLLLAAVAHGIAAKVDLPSWSERFTDAAFILLAALMIAGTLPLISRDYQPFIYFQF